jgi:hypothetical protein
MTFLVTSMLIMMMTAMSPFFLFLALSTRANVLLDLNIMICCPISQFLKVATSMRLQEICIERICRG